MGHPTMTEQRESARQLAPDLLDRLDHLESGEALPEWVLAARREIGAELLAESVVGRWPADHDEISGAGGV